jgi:hypothetical protein
MIKWHNDQFVDLHVAFSLLLHEYYEYLLEIIKGTTHLKFWIVVP